jgi:hypothetical protein
MQNILSRFALPACLLAGFVCLFIPAPPATAQQQPAANASSGKWQTYRNERYAFRLSYPPDSQLHTHRSREYQYVRIRNYESPAGDQDVRQPGEYSLEIFVFDHRLGHKLASPCRELLRDTRAVKAGRVNAVRGLAQSADETSGIPFALCLQGMKVDVLVKATEEDQLGALANRILDSVRFGD